MENSELFENLNNILGENNIPDNLKDILNTLNSGDSTNTNSEKNSQSNSNSSISPEMIQNLVGMFNSNSKNKTSNDTSTIDIEMLMKMKTIMDKMNNNQDDPRASLLLSLKPYLKPSRKSKIEQYIKLFNMTKVMDVFNSSGGDSK